MMNDANAMKLQETEFLEGVLPSMNKRINYLDKQIELEEQTLEENAELNQKLKEKLKETEGDKKKTIDDRIRAAEERLETVRADNRKAKDVLMLFLERYYAKPDSGSDDDDDDERDDNDNDESGSDEDKAPKDIKGLKETIVMLMNRYTSETGRGQYVNVDEMGLWSPYVELLIRSGVAEKHPSDSRLLRLCNF